MKKGTFLAEGPLALPGASIAGRRRYEPFDIPVELEMQLTLR